MSAEAPARPRSPGWMKLLLVLSLTANLLVIGVIAGHELREGGRRGGADRAVGWMLDMVPEERRAMAEAHFAEARGALDAAHDDRGAQIDAVIATIRAEPYRPADLEAAMATFGEARAQRWVVLRERLATLLAEFTPAERTAFADAFDQRMTRWRERRGD